MRKSYLAVSTLLLAFLSPASVLAVTDGDIEELKAEIRNMKQSYENRIAELESKLQKLEAAGEHESAEMTRTVHSESSGRRIYGNEFNPSIGVILNGRYSSFSSDTSEIAGFAVGEEGKRDREGLSVGESELNFAANIDDKFYGSLTAAIAREDGEDKVELEEAYVLTLAGLGLPNGLNVKAGRAFWTMGYLNEHHTHADDFADRPLPYRVFLNKSFNDDGLEVTYVLPTDLYTEIGGGLFRGDDFPFGGASDDGAGAWSAFARVGGDIGDTMSWRIGGYVLAGKADEGRHSNEDTVTFIGDSDLYATDLRFTWAPTGNARERELTLQAEYFLRDEDGAHEDAVAGTGVVAYDENSSGWYAQAVYKFLAQWRIGGRYSRLDAPNVPAGLTESALDSEGHDPSATAVMVDWTNSEFSRWRLQYNHEELSRHQNDDQIILQYIMSLGAHGAHAY
jgi:hypothetical protein